MGNPFALQHRAIGVHLDREAAMGSQKESWGPKRVVTPLAHDCAVLDQNQRIPTATLHHDIEALLPRLTRYARAMTHDVADAEDLVQDCVARALTKLHLWKEGTDLRAWLFTILHNQHVSQRRRAAREGTSVVGYERAQASTCTAHQIEYVELRKLERAIMSLPHEQRNAVLLSGLTRWSYDEIAVACDVPVGTIRSRLSRGRATLRKLTGIAPARHSPSWATTH
jgi:RNA polymerase sigma-70 factor, ECF subfamily